MSRWLEYISTAKRNFIFFKIYTPYFLAMLYFPLHFGIFPAKIFVICSVCVCMFEYMSVYQVCSAWNDLFTEG